MIAVDLARLAQDMRTWMTPEFSLFALADEHAGGSSALPHAKVPFGLQSVIGGATIAATRLAGEMAASINPSEGSEPIYQSASLYGMAADVVAWTTYISDVVRGGKFNLEEMKRKSTLDYAGSSEAHDRLVYDFGVPFRTGHKLLGALVRAHHLGEPAPDLNKLDQGGNRPRCRDRPGRNHRHRAWQEIVCQRLLISRCWMRRGARSIGGSAPKKKSCRQQARPRLRSNAWSKKPEPGFRAMGRVE